MTEIARERARSHPLGDRIDFRVGPAERRPLGDAFADVVLAFDSFDHWQDKPLGLAEVRRVLKPAGRFVVVKDGGVGDGREDGQAFLDELCHAGFEVARERRLQEEDVSFTMWQCRLSSDRGIA